jgi:hypothetical protein
LVCLDGRELRLNNKTIVRSTIDTPKKFSSIETMKGLFTSISISMGVIMTIEIEINVNGLFVVSIELNFFWCINNRSDNSFVL